MRNTDGPSSLFVDSPLGDLPFISCVMPTYGRPAYVHEAIWMFLQQDYPIDRRELIVLNDCPGQTLVCDLPPELGVRVINQPARYKTLGEKRNACIELAQGELIAVWDDDDAYLPWRLTYSHRQMRQENTDFYRADTFWAYWGDPELHHNQSTREWVNHPNTLFSKALWDEVGGYPAMDVGEDGVFFEAIYKKLGKGFLVHPVPEHERFFILRGKSRYAHMCMSGGQRGLDLAPGVHQIKPRPIQDPLLRSHYNHLIAEYYRQEPYKVQAANPKEPVISVCLTVKNRSKVPTDNGALHLLPATIDSIIQAASGVEGSIEIVIADFYSDDAPLRGWLNQYIDGVLIRIVNVDGGFSRGRGLNIAAQSARSQRLFLTDADVLIRCEALSRAIQVIDQSKAWFPTVQYLDESGEREYWQEYGYGIAALHRDTFESSGGLPEFDSWGGEDDVFHERVSRKVGVLRERSYGLIHQWHPEHIRHEHYSQPRKSDYYEYSGRNRQAVDPRGTPRVRYEASDSAAIDRRKHSCVTCSQCDGIEDNVVRCRAAADSVDLSNGRCKLRKWQKSSGLQTNTSQAVLQIPIECRVFEGLTNRINGMVSALATGRRVLLFWAINRHCPVRFNQVFNPVAGVKVFEEYTDQYEYEFMPDRLCWFYPRNVLGMRDQQFRDRIYQAYRLLWDQLKIKTEEKLLSTDDLGLHYRHHLADSQPFEDFKKKALEVIAACRPRRVYVATDSDQHGEKLARAIRAYVPEVYTGHSVKMEHDLDRSVEGVAVLINDLHALSACGIGVLTNSARSTVPDILRCLGVSSYTTFDDGVHRHGGRDDLYERKDVESLLSSYANSSHLSETYSGAKT